MPQLMGKHKIQIVPEAGILALPEAQLGAVKLLVAFLGRIDPRQEGGLFRIILIDQLIIHNFIFILPLGIYRCPFFLVYYVCGEILPMDKWSISILLPLQVTYKTDNILGIILVDHGIGIGTNDNQGIRAISDQ